jgi:hypothetical protein
MSVDGAFDSHRIDPWVPVARTCKVAVRLVACDCLLKSGANLTWQSSVVLASCAVVFHDIEKRPSRRVALRPLRVTPETTVHGFLVDSN